MSELSRRRARERTRKAARAVACFCDRCERILYVTEDDLFCPVCSSSVIPGEIPAARPVTASENEVAVT